MKLEIFLLELSQLLFAENWYICCLNYLGEATETC